MLKISGEIKNAYKNKNILVTGGTGSIGLALVKQLISCKPKSIKVLTNDENSIFDSSNIKTDVVAHPEKDNPTNPINNSIDIYLTISKSTHPPINKKPHEGGA